MPRRKERTALQVVAKGLEVENLRLKLASSFPNEVEMIETALGNLTIAREILDNQINQVKDQLDYARSLKGRATKRLSKQTLRPGRSGRARGVQRRPALQRG